ncbi:hypothetical protein ACM66B_006912 [Microbotryomycetes sp. NB124-2]
MVVNVTTTRDLKHFRKYPASKPAVLNLYTSFTSLLADPQHSVLRSSFLPALLKLDLNPRSANVSPEYDQRLLDLFNSPPDLVLVQGQVNLERVHQHWSTTTATETQQAQNSLKNSIVIQYAIVTELENALSDQERAEDVANLNMFLLACFTYELSHWIYVTCHGYEPSSTTETDLVSLRGATSTNGSMSSLQSQNSILVSPRVNGNDVGVKAIQTMFGVLFELLTYAIGDRQVVKRRLPIRRTPVLTPPLIYTLIGDSPSIRDISNEPPTHLRWLVPWKQHDDLNSVTAACSPISVPSFHGKCEIGSGAGVASTVAKTDAASTVPTAGAGVGELPRTVEEFRVNLNADAGCKGVGDKR